jgi:hypothetical protein
MPFFEAGTHKNKIDMIVSLRSLSKLLHRLKVVEISYSKMPYGIEAGFSFSQARKAVEEYQSHDLHYVR